MAGTRGSGRHSERDVRNECKDPKALHTTASMFKTGPAFNIGAYMILVITAVLYAVFW